jgi:very-short-patch-repair endonuclease
VPLRHPEGSYFSAARQRRAIPMFSGNDTSRERRRQLRSQSTEIERNLWAQLRAQRFAGFKFRRQHPIGPYFADFCCTRRRLVIELDGDQHAEPDAEQYDALRTAFLNQQGYRVIRFGHHEVTRQLEVVLNVIYAALTKS